MGLLDEPGLDRLLEAGCAKCGARKLAFATYVEGLLPIMGGEPVGKLTWVYDGEKFIDGVYEVTCGLQGGRVRRRRLPALSWARRSGARARHAQPLAGACRLPVV